MRYLCAAVSVTLAGSGEPPSELARASRPSSRGETDSGRRRGDLDFEVPTMASIVATQVPTVPVGRAPVLFVG